MADGIFRLSRLGDFKMPSVERQGEYSRDGDDGKDAPVQDFTNAVVADGAALISWDHLSPRFSSSRLHWLLTAQHAQQMNAAGMDSTDQAIMIIRVISPPVA